MKKAVIEEQEKTKTLQVKKKIYGQILGTLLGKEMQPHRSVFFGFVFQETVRQKDQSIRKYEQEIDSLQFRNDQVMIKVLKWLFPFELKLNFSLL